MAKSGVGMGRDWTFKNSKSMPETERTQTLKAGLKTMACLRSIIPLSKK